MFMDWKTISFTGEFYQILKKKKTNTNPENSKNPAAKTLVRTNK